VLRMNRIGVAALVWVLMSSFANAQSVRGVVVDAGSIPVPGVVVRLIDSASNIAATGLTNAQGEFGVVARAAGTYRLRTLRIGFRPTDSSPLVLMAGADRAERIVLTGLPVGLDTMRVAGTSSCRSIGDGSAYAVWEQVHAAVSAAALTAAARSTFATTITYERTLEADARRVRTQSSTVQSGYVKEPWLSRSPEQLRRDGYVVDGPDNSTNYYAPGLGVLLSPLFVEDHCFHVVLERDRIGLAFQPTPERRKIADIRGTLWLDRKSAELRSIEYRYVNILAEQEAVARGGVGFVRMANGAWTISRWDIRMPLVEQVVRPRGDVELRVTAVHLAGGELALARQGNDTLWARPPVSLAGVVLDSTTGRPVRGARVSLAGTQLRDSTDDRGRFSISGLLLGEYTMEIRTRSLDSANAVHQMPVSFTDSTAALTVRVPSIGQLVASFCGTKALEWPGVLLGTLTAPVDSVPPRNVQVTASWRQRFMPVSGASVNEVSQREQFVDTRTDSHGMFRFCGVPVDNPISVTLAGNAATPTVVRIPRGGRFARIELSAVTHAAVATFAGVVVDSLGKPIVAATVDVPGPARSAVTDDQGAFRIAGIAPGNQRVVVRRIGFRSIDTTLAFSADRTVQRRFELVRAVTLDTVIVAESPFDRVMASFDENRRLGLGQFKTRGDLAKLGNVTMDAIFQPMRGARVARGRRGEGWLVGISGGPREVKPAPEDSALRGAKPYCYAQVWIDNVLVYRGVDKEPLFDLNSLRADGVEAIEYYANLATMPSRYVSSSSTCGVLVVWIRRSKE
jgi:hypothetical protein